MCRETRRMGTRSIYSFRKNNQHADYRLVNPYNTAKRRTWVPEAFTLSQKIVNALIIGSFTHTP